MFSVQNLSESLSCDSFSDLRLQPLKRRVPLLYLLLGEDPRGEVGRSGLRVHLQGDTLKLNQREELTE